MAHNQYKERGLTCKVCDKVFVGRFPKSQQTCSQTCGLILRSKNRRTGMDKFCGFCSTPIYVQKVHLRTLNFCNNSCHNNYQKRNKLSFICKICGKTFYWSKSRIKENNPTYCSIPCRNKDPERYAILLNMNVIQQAMKSSSLEKRGYFLLMELDLDFVKQKLLFDKFCVDAVIETQKIVIQFDGDYWHGNENKFENLQPRQLKRKRLDKSQDAYLQKCGYKIIRIWESDLKHHYTKIKTLLQAALIQQKHILFLDSSNHLVI